MRIRSRLGPLVGLLLACEAAPPEGRMQGATQVRPTEQPAGTGGAAGSLQEGSAGSAAGGAGGAGSGGGCEGAACVPEPCGGQPCACELSGIFVARTRTRSHWDAVGGGVTAAAIAAGQADLYSYSVWELSSDGALVSASARGCGGESPELCSPFFKETFAQGFDQALVDSGKLPSESWSLHAGDGRLIADDHVLLLGARLAPDVDPLGAFPATYDDPGLEWVDADQDDNPGVTVSVHPPGAVSETCGYPYAYLPVEQDLQPARASHIYTAGRWVQSLELAFETCDVLRGSLITHAIDGRVHGCRLSTGEPCTEAQTRFLDSQPSSEQIDSVSVTMVRVPEAPACADARAFAFP